MLQTVSRESASLCPDRVRRCCQRLSMLWESIEPTQALEQRFGFNGLAAVTDWVSGLINETWGITARNCNRMVISSPMRSSGRTPRRADWS